MIQAIEGAIILAILAIGILVVVEYIILTIPEVIKWFNARNTLFTAGTRDIIRFTLSEKLASGDYEVIQGVFNQDKGELLDARKIKAKKMDDQLTQMHEASPLVLYE